MQEVVRGVGLCAFFWELCGELAVPGEGWGELRHGGMVGRRDASKRSTKRKGVSTVASNNNISTATAYISSLALTCT